MQSIRNKVENTIDLFHDLQLDILCLTETWLTDNDTPIISSLNTKPLSLIHLLRPGTLYGGGTGVLYKKNY